MRGFIRFHAFAKRDAAGADLKTVFSKKGALETT